MTVRELTLSEAKTIYSTLMSKDFPPQELRPFPLISRLYDNGIYTFLGAFDQNELIAYAFLTKPKTGTPLLDYYAVIPERRGTGVGSEFIKSIREAAGGTLLLEVEDLDRAETDEERLIRSRRIAFYERAGVKMSGVRSRVFGVYFAIMGYFADDADDISIRADLISVYHELFPPKMYEKEVQML